MEVQITFLILILIFIFGALIWLQIQKKGRGTEWKMAVNQNLLELNDRIKSPDFHVVKSALIDADKLLDYVMRKRGIQGESMGERLKNSEKYFDKNFYNKLWHAHKIRNRLVHEIGNTEKQKEVIQAFSTLQKGIRTLS